MIEPSSIAFIMAAVVVISSGRGFRIEAWCGN